MGILEQGLEKGLSAVGLGGIFKRTTADPQGFSPDFPAGLVVEEIIDGQIKSLNEGFGFQLVGSFMPLIPFSFGGEQKVEKTYYPGTSEPSLQVLGSREDDVTLKGKLKTKRFKDEELKLAASSYQERIDGVRLRGNVLKLTLGDWVRYGFLDKGTFMLNRLTDIEYEIKFTIIGFNLPTGCKFASEDDVEIDRATKDLTNKASELLASSKNYPDTMPRTFSEFLDDQISTVASAINLVTNFIEGAISDIENIVKSANRAVGLIRNARSVVSRSARRIGALKLDIDTLGAGQSATSFKAAAQIKNANHINATLSSYTSLQALLAALQAKYASLANTVPYKRHLIKDGDTLQRISIKYYNSADNWKKIYDHNKLSSSALTVGSVLEIPKV